MNKKVYQFFQKNLESYGFHIFVLNIEPATLKSFGAQNLGMFNKNGKPIEALHVEPKERVVYGYPNTSSKFDFALIPILQSINVAQNILGGEPEVLTFQDPSKKPDIGGLEIKSVSAKSYNCFMKIIQKNFAIAIILDSQIPTNIGFYAKSALFEFLDSRFDFKFHTFYNTLRAKEFAEKFSFSVPFITNTTLSQKQLADYKIQNLQLEQFSASLFYEIHYHCLDFPTSSLGSMPQILGNILNVENGNPAIKLPISEKLLIDASEFTHAIYEDMSQINELISIKKQQALVPEGVAMFYKGFMIVNSLEPKYLSKVVQRCKISNFWQGGSMHQNSLPEIQVELFTLNKYLRRSAAEISYQNVRLMEDFVTTNYYDRFEEQKKTGNRGPLDSSDDDISEKSSSEEESQGEDQPPKVDKEEVGKQKKISIMKQYQKLMSARQQHIVAINKFEQENAKLISDNQDYLDQNYQESGEKRGVNGMPQVQMPNSPGQIDKQMMDPNDPVNEKAQNYFSGYKDIQNHKKQYALGVIFQYDLTIAVVSHVMSYDVKNEFDPLLIERMKNCLKQLAEKDFIKNVHEEMTLNATLMSKEARTTLIEKLNPNAEEDNSSQNESVELVTCRMRGQDDSFLPPADQRIKRDLDQGNEKVFGLNMSQMQYTSRPQQPGQNIQQKKNFHIQLQSDDVNPMMVSNFNIYHYACYNLKQNNVLTIDLKVQSKWIKEVQKIIYDCYAKISTEILEKIQLKIENEEFEESSQDDIMGYIEQQISKINDAKNPKIHNPFENEDQFFQQEIFQQGMKIEVQNKTMYVVCKILKPIGPPVSEKFNFKKEKVLEAAEDENFKQRFDDYLQSDDSSNESSSDLEDFEADKKPDLNFEDSTSDTSIKSKKMKKTYLDTALVFIAYNKQVSQNDFHDEQVKLLGEKQNTKRYQKSQMSLQALASLLLKQNQF